MKKFAIIRLGKDSLTDIRTLDALHGSPAQPISFTVQCAQVPQELSVGDYAFFCLGSDNSKGIPTPWKRGVRALGVVTSKSGGPGYNDKWDIGVEIKVVLPDSVSQKDLLARAPAAYYWSSDLPVLGVDVHSNQTVQLVKSEEPTQDVRALAYGLDKIYSAFSADTRKLYPELAFLFDYSPPLPSVSSGATSSSNAEPGANIIFFGPPGTGKSTAVMQRVGSAPFFRTQFHPEYNHADLIGSYRPVVGFESDPSNKILGHDGKATSRPVNYFAFVPGPLTEALECAFGGGETSQKPDHVFLVIEEINRGDCAAIFGEAFQLLDRDKIGRSEFGITPKSELLTYFRSRGVNYDIAGDGKLYLPPNLSLLATMNTSDQSLYPMDSAFKRRWHWVACPIDFKQLLDYTAPARPFLHDGITKWDWIPLLQRLNKNIVRDRMEDKQLGPWFIKPAIGGSIPFETFLNKCLFYLWHDVFRDEQLSELSPFKADGPQVFGEAQANIRENGLAAGFKTELLTGLDIASEPPSAIEPSSEHSLGETQTIPAAATEAA